MQRAVLLVVHVHHDGLAIGADVIVVDELRQRDRATLQLVLQLRVLLLQQVIVVQLDVEHVAAVLDIPHARLPEHTQQIHVSDADLTQPVESISIPGAFVHGSASFQLSPPCLAVCALKVCLLQDARDDCAQVLGLVLVSRLTRKDHGLRVILHCVRMLGDQYVMQPAAAALEVLIPANVILFARG